MEHNPRCVDYSKLKDCAFDGFKISGYDALDGLRQRSRCSVCDKSRKYYCYGCLVPVPEIRDSLPSVKLPLIIEIIKHAGELDSKSTAPHAAILAPEHVFLRHYPDIPIYNPSEDVLIFPGTGSVTLNEYHSFRSAAEGQAGMLIRRAIFIDCTWFQTGAIVSDPRLRGLTKVEIKQHETKFWRPNGKKPTTYLSTIEAIYYFVREYHNAAMLEPYEGQYDDLLFLFKYMYMKIKQLHPQIQSSS